VPRAEFHERQYELAANVELIAGRGDFFTPPTTAERRLGIDCALTPGDARIWGLLGLPPPRGASVGAGTFPTWPTVFPSGAEPPFLASLFVQYKRPDYLTTRRAKEWRHHNRAYFRMNLTAHQHQLLLDLEQTVGTDGIVLYAAPSFWRYDDMWLNQGAGHLMASSMLVQASAIGPGHNLWTWTPGGRGIAHSDPVETRFDTVTGVRDKLTSITRSRERQAPREHLQKIATAMLEAQVAQKPRERWEEEIGGKVWADAAVPSAETVSELADAAIVAEGATKARVSWLIIAMSERPSGE
jgi:hypothetical protein